MNFTAPEKQQGIALAVSLIFLVLITIIGVSSMRGTTMNELMSANAQQKSATFQIAESVIEGVWDTGYILKNTPTQLTNPPAVDLTKDKNDFDFNTSFDVAAHGGSPAINVNAQATLQYCGEEFKLLAYSQNADESTPAFVAHVYSIHGVGEIASANAASDHDQRGYLIRPETGRTGNCP
ncbi:MAG: PilX N-terminal domain-containing pilus assembly protein [Gammaproteobacteria bacterium]